MNTCECSANMGVSTNNPIQFVHSKVTENFDDDLSLVNDRHK